MKNLTFRFRKILRVAEPARVKLLLASSALFGLIFWHGCSSRTHDVWMSAARGNIHRLRMAMLVYAGEHDGNYPFKWSQLVSQVERISPKDFVCLPMDDAPGELSDVDSWAEYTLVPGRRLDEPEGTVVAFCKASHWRRHGGAFVIYVEWFDFYPTRAMAFLTKTLRVPVRKE